MAGSLEPRMTGDENVPLQWTLMSIVPIALTILLLLLCGFIKSFKKGRNLTMKEDKSKRIKEQTRLTKMIKKQEVSTVNGKQAAGDLQNGKSSLAEGKGQTKTATETNGVVIQNETENPSAGEQQAERGSSDSTGTSTKTFFIQQELTESFKHRKLPSLPHKEAAAFAGHLNSNENPSVLHLNPEHEQMEISIYEELPEEKDISEVAASNEATGGLVFPDWKIPVHESSNEVEEQWPPAPVMASSGFPADVLYIDVDNVNENVHSDQTVIVPNPMPDSTEHVTNKQGSWLHAKSSIGTAGEVTEVPSSIPLNVSWRFHLDPSGDKDDNTQAQDPNNKAVYSQVKKKHKHTELSTSPTSEEKNDDVPPPVPEKRFNIEAELMNIEFQNQVMDEPLPPPPPPLFQDMD